jgi:hypothetical protein
MAPGVPPPSTAFLESAVQVEVKRPPFHLQAARGVLEGRAAHPSPRQGPTHPLPSRQRPRRASLGSPATGGAEPTRPTNSTPVARKARSAVAHRRGPAATSLSVIMHVCLVQLTAGHPINRCPLCAICRRPATPDRSNKSAHPTTSDIPVTQCLNMPTRKQTSPRQSPVLQSTVSAVLPRHPAGNGGRAVCSSQAEGAVLHQKDRFARQMPKAYCRARQFTQIPAHSGYRRPINLSSTASGHHGRSSEPCHGNPAIRTPGIKLRSRSCPHR